MKRDGFFLGGVAPARVRFPDVQAGSGARRGHEPGAGCTVWARRERSPPSWKEAAMKRRRLVRRSPRTAARRCRSWACAAATEEPQAVGPR